MDNKKNHEQAVNEIIELSNKLKNNGSDIQLVSAALMSASAIYSTYAYAGNEGYLQKNGVDKIVRMYDKQLKHIQELKKNQVQNS